MEIKNTKVYGLDEAIIRSGYPMSVGDVPTMELRKEIMVDKDYDRASKLGKVPTGTGHDNYLKAIIVQFDLKYPQYFTPQLQRYNWIDIISSQSKMHRLTKNKLSANNCNRWVLDDIMYMLNGLIDSYNENETYPFIYVYETEEQKQLLKIRLSSKYNHFMRIISNLPAGYEQWMGVTTNYLQLKTIYQQRKNHKLKDDWGYFCAWIETLPMVKEMCLKDNV